MKSKEEIATDRGNIVYLDSETDEKGEWWFIKDSENVRISMSLKPRERLLSYYTEYRLSSGEKLKPQDEK